MTKQHKLKVKIGHADRQIARLRQEIEQKSEEVIQKEYALKFRKAQGRWPDQRPGKRTPRRRQPRPEPFCGQRLVASPQQDRKDFYRFTLRQGYDTLLDLQDVFISDPVKALELERIINTYTDLRCWINEPDEFQLPGTGSTTIPLTDVRRSGDLQDAQGDEFIE